MLRIRLWQEGRSSFNTDDGLISGTGKTFCLITVIYAREVVGSVWCFTGDQTLGVSLASLCNTYRYFISGSKAYKNSYILSICGLGDLYDWEPRTQIKTEYDKLVIALFPSPWKSLISPISLWVLVFSVFIHRHLSAGIEFLYKEVRHCHQANQLNVLINCIDLGIPRNTFKKWHQCPLLGIRLWFPPVCTYGDYLLQSMPGSDSCGSVDQLMISSPGGSIGQSVTEGGRKTEKREEKKEWECMMGRNWGNHGGERRWSGAISVTSHLPAQRFNGLRLVRGQRRKRVKLWSGWMDAARWPFEPESPSVSVFTLCQREEERLCFTIMK